MKTARSTIPSHSRRWRSVLRLLCLLTAVSTAQAQVTTRTDAVGKQLNEWFAAGTAAGLAGIQYENRDGQHSPLNTAQYPQLQVLKAVGEDKGPAHMLRRTPTFGNCSMASAPEQIGCLPRGLYMRNKEGGDFLFKQYVANNFFIYPEHLDHDRGANGIGGYGDLMPLNTPALLISQGSSFSDMPFLNAFLCAAAAFTPETQKLLIDKGLLMPTLQAIFRRSNKNVLTDADYYSGKAHPVVFDAAQIDEMKMIQMAHDMRPETVPPVAVLEVKDETKLERGVHFFEPAGGQFAIDIASSPASIGRILRGNTSEYGLLISMEKSFALVKRPVGLRFALLQGDPRCVKIDQQKGSPLARIRVRHQPPVAGARGTRSHRIDIGVFATDGKTISAPAILSFYNLPNEMHFHDAQGRLTEIHYQTHNPDPGLPTDEKDTRWLQVMHALTREDLPPLLKNHLEGQFSHEEAETIRKTRTDIHKRLLAANQLAADPQQKEAAEKLKAIVADDVQKALTAKLPGPKQRVTAIALLLALESFLSDPLLFIRNQAEITALADQSPKKTAPADLRAEIHRLTLTGILQQNKQGIVSTASEPKKLTAGEVHALRGLHLTVLSQIFFPDALERSPAPAWVPPLLTTKKPWRDVLHYADAESATPTGWTRHHDLRRTEFNAEGQVIPVEKNTKPLPVTYLLDQDGNLSWKTRG